MRCCISYPLLPYRINDLNRVAPPHKYQIWSCWVLGEISKLPKYFSFLTLAPLPLKFTHSHGLWPTCANISLAHQQHGHLVNVCFIAETIYELIGPYCARHESGALPGTWGKWGQLGGGGWERARPPGSREDKQSTPSKEEGNMEKEEEGRTSRSRGHGVSYFSKRRL